MNPYEEFAWLTTISELALGIGAAGFLMELYRTGRWRSRSTSFFSGLFFVAVPARSLFLLLSKPLPTDRTYSLWFHVCIILLWLAAGAVNAVRSRARLR